MKLRSYLIALALLAVMPVALFGAIVVAFQVAQQRDTFVRGVDERTLAMMTAVDSKLGGALATLTALAQVQSLRDGDVALFRASAQSVLATQEDWITVNLALPSGQQVMNVRARGPGPLPAIAESQPLLARVVRDRQPIVGELLQGPVTRRWDFAVRVPVVREGEVAYVLSAVVDPASMLRLLEAQALPPDWEGVILDQGGRVVARTGDGGRSVGRRAHPELLARLAQSANGFVRAANFEGVDAYRAYRRSPTTGWVFAMAIPPRAVDGAADRALLVLGSGFLAAIVMAVLLAALVARRISRPMAALASATDAMAQEREVAIPGPSRIAELRSLEEAVRMALAARQALRARTEELQTILDIAPVQIWIADGDCRRIIGNRAAYEQHGLEQGINASFDAPVRDLPPGLRIMADGRELAPGEMPMQIAARTGKPIRDFELEVVHADGRRISMWAHATPILDEGGNVRSVIGVYVDITERKRVERALREADRRKDEFLATLSHELRNPVAALTTVSHLLRGGMPEGADGAKIQDIMERQTRQLRRLVDDLLDLSRVRMGKLSLKREPLDLAQLVAGVIDTWRRSGLLAGRASVVADLAPAAVVADRARMEQVFSNLLHNAVKFTPATGHIRVKVGELEGEALMSVADSGCGIRPEAIEAIFEPFAQADRTLHMSEGGMGLGLPLVKRLVEAHGGAVRVESGGDGQGSTFTVRMPAASSASDQPAQSEGAVWA